MEGSESQESFFVWQNKKAEKAGCVFQNGAGFRILESVDLLLSRFSIRRKDFGTMPKLFLRIKQIGVFSVGQWIALALDENDAFVKERVKEIIYGDNSTGLLTHEIVRGILMSRDAEAHRMLGDLLLAAKLQEGLRQTILEACDECSLEGFEYVMNLILDNNLERFTSVVRAMGTWMGLNPAEIRPKAIRKALEISRKLVDDPKKAEALLDGDDALELYVALWGVALREIDDVRKPLLEFVKSGRKYKRLAALHFLRSLDDRAMDKAVVFELLDDDDPRTAEIMSKTILLSEDEKIKDPTILAAIKG